MAIVTGTNAGFVTVAPTTNPGGSSTAMTGEARGIRVTSPSGALKIIELGYYTHSATDDEDFDIGIYAHDSGDDEPGAILHVVRNQSKGTSSGWIVVTGLDLAISENTTYWLAVQVDSIGSGHNLAAGSESGSRAALKWTGTETELTDPWGDSSGNFNNDIYAIYAVYETEGFTRKIKISGTFVDKPIKTKVAGTFEDKPIKIKVGGTFQDA